MLKKIFSKIVINVKRNYTTETFGQDIQNAHKLCGEMNSRKMYANDIKYTLSVEEYRTTVVAATAANYDDDGDDNKNWCVTRIRIHSHTYRTSALWLVGLPACSIASRPTTNI